MEANDLTATAGNRQGEGAGAGAGGEQKRENVKGVRKGRAE